MAEVHSIREICAGPLRLFARGAEAAYDGAAARGSRSMPLFRRFGIFDYVFCDTARIGAVFVGFARTVEAVQ